MAEPILNISTTEPESFDRPVVRIDGVAYEMAVRNDFTIMELSKIERLGQRLSELVTAEEAAGEDGDAETPAREVEVSAIYGRVIARIIRGIPAEVLARLHDADKLALTLAFLGSSVLSQTPTPTNRAQKRRARSRSTGRSSSPG